MMPLGTAAPDFELPDVVSGWQIRLSSLPSAPVTVVMFICNHCPYVVYVLPTLLQLTQEYAQKGVRFLAISSNDAAAYPEDGPAKMKDLAADFDFTFPYLYDETQETARAYDAACTPDFYVFDAQMRLFYRGQMDSSRPKRHPVEPTGEDLRGALDAALNGQNSPAVQRPSGGCNIKWKEGN